MGPYDQDKDLKLNVQMPLYNLDFESYTEFKHSCGSSWRAYSIKKSYEELDDLNKVKALEFINVDVDEGSVDRITDIEI